VVHRKAVWEELRQLLVAHFTHRVASVAEGAALGGLERLELPLLHRHFLEHRRRADRSIPRVDKHHNLPSNRFIFLLRVE